MSKANNRNKPPQNARQIQRFQPDPADLPRALPPGNQVDLSELSFRQQAALPAIAAAPSLAQAARAAGIDENTLRRWLKEPLFAERLAEIRQQSVVIAREELCGLARQGMSVFAEAMADPDPAIRIRAARYALSYAVQLAEVQNLGATVQEMRQLLTQSKTDENTGK